MARANDFGGVDLCPGREELAAFERGQLPLKRLEAIAEHLERCAQCESSLQELQVEDTIQQHLRHTPSEGLWLDESLYLRLEDRARAIALEPAEQPTVSDAGAGAREALPLPLAFGTHLLLEQLEPGGMGIVFKARQETLKRVVALKVIRAATFASADAQARFRREGEALARMRHANVVQIYEFGEYRGLPFYTMEWLDGGTLARKLDGGPLLEREAAELLRTLARAVQALHDERIIHRDLKPGNILFAADGTPKIADFGLAKVLDEDSDTTQSDAILGTPAYMAPEQARGSRDIGNTADVYALGVIFYEMLTGRPPLKGPSRQETMELVRTREPERPSRHRPKLERALEAICLKCLEKEPAQRYPSAGALAEDLDRWLRGEPTQVRPPSRIARIRRTVRRHPRIVAAIGLLVLLPSVFLALLYLKDPERKLKALEAQLRRGEAVTLIGEQGGPAWFDWGMRNRPGTFVPSRQGDGAFTFSALDATVLTPLRDPQRSYRLQAEVRHEDSARLGEVGLAFAYSRHATSQGLQHCFCTLTFNDFEALFPDPDGKQMFSRLCFMVRRFSETGPDFGGESPENLKYFTPAALAMPEQYPWRSLAVEVRPEGIDLFWGKERLARVTRPTILDRFEMLKKTRIENRMVNVFPDLQPAFSPRDALGLFVYHGKASFRRVRVEPLPEP